MKKMQSRREFLGAAAGIAALGHSRLSRIGHGSDWSAHIKSFELDEVTISRLHEGMKSGEHTSRSITERYLERIHEIDKGGPGLNSVIEINPDALRIADKMDAERKTNGFRSPLHGIPVMIKDNIATADRMMTTAGSLALFGSIASIDSYVAKKLREAGAVILAKTNLSEWANFRGRRSISGWSGRGGQTRNPYALDRNPSGSSSGSGSAPAANLCVGAIGTETDGSIVSPSSRNCVVGIKPTVGLVGRSGIIPISHTQDTAGPMARTVADAAIMLGALTGIDERDSVTQESAGKSYRDYRQFLDPGGMNGARIGIVRDFSGFPERVDRQFEYLLKEMKRLGAVLIDPVEMPSIKEIRDSEYNVMLYEFKEGIKNYLDGLGPSAPVRTLEEIIEFNENNRDKELRYFGQNHLIAAQEKGPLTDPEYKKALETCRRLSRKEGIDAAMDKDNLDALVAPTTGLPSLIDMVNGDYSTGGGCSRPAAVSGYPHITIPGGFIFGLPFGVSFFGRAYSEPKLIKIAFAFEQATKIRHKPQFLRTANLNL